MFNVFYAVLLFIFVLVFLSLFFFVNSVDVSTSKHCHSGVLVSFIVDFTQYDPIVTFIRPLVFSGSKVEITVRATNDASFRPVLHLYYLHCNSLFYPSIQGKWTLVALYRSQVLLQQKSLTSILGKA